MCDELGMSGQKRFVYILRGEFNPGRHYVGVTDDVAVRLRWHNAGQNTFTARDRPWSVVVAMEFATQLDVIRFTR
jgi:predicted GIY-YIG superfamily endonuclease